MYVLFYVCIGIGAMDWPEKGIIYIYVCERFRSVRLLVTGFDCPEVTVWLTGR